MLHAHGYKLFNRLSSDCSIYSSFLLNLKCNTASRGNKSLETILWEPLFSPWKSSTWKAHLAQSDPSPSQPPAVCDPDCPQLYITVTQWSWQACFVVVKWEANCLFFPHLRTEHKLSLLALLLYLFTVHKGMLNRAVLTFLCSHWMDNRVTANT